MTSIGGTRMRLDYRNQTILTIIIIIITNTVSTLYASWELFSFGFIAAGLLWIFHPVVSKDMKATKASLWGIRFIGFIIAALGIVRMPFFPTVNLPFIG